MTESAAQTSAVRARGVHRVFHTPNTPLTQAMASGSTPFGADLLPGARNAISNCLKTQHGEHLVVVTDLDTQEIGAALCAAGREAGAIVQPIVLEEFSPRPMMSMPDSILHMLDAAQVAVYAVQSKEGELPSRKQFVGRIERNGIRYAHMVMINRDIMLEGMCADYEQVNAVGQRILDMVTTCTSVKTRTPAGTDLEATFDPSIKWIKTCGIITPQIWSNLPAGEVFTAPANVNGIFVVDGTLGDYFCDRFGDLSQHPLYLEIENNRLRSLKCDNRAVAEEFWAYSHIHSNSDRVGEFALGANIGVSKLVNNLLQDEKFPGVHIALGDPYGSQTGADWSAPTHVDGIARECSIWIDNQQIMENGRYLFL